MTTFLQRHKISLIHVSFWCVYASFFFYQISSPRGGQEPDWGRVFRDLSFHLVAVIFISYLNYFFFLSRFLKHKNFWRYLLEFLPVFLIFSYGFWLGKQYIIDGFKNPDHWVYSTRFAINIIWNTLFLVVFVGFLKFVEDWFELEARKKELQNERLTSELRFLKAQINPHFLFNTLNNLYYLAFTQSPNTTKVVAKLSQMMRYMLYDSNHARVPLAKEIEYMENYISLEQLRLNEEVPIQFKLNGNPDGVTIAPLIFITFLENAFKHGVSNSTANSWVNVDIDINGKVCTYKVGNSKIPDSGKTVTEESGIGLQNVKRRLDLSYPDNYELQVQDLDDRYLVELKLNLV